MLDIDGGVEIGVRAVATDSTAKRLLVGPVGSIYMMTHAALLRGVGAPDPDGGDASFGGIPGDLPGDVRQVGDVQIGIHGTSLVLHGRDRQVFVGDLRALVPGKALVDGAVDRLPHMAGEALPAPACGGGELLDALLL